VILVDDGSSISATEVLAGRETRFPLLVVTQPNSGQALARHRGICRAQHELIVIVDDDMRLPPAFLSAHRDAHERGNRVVLGQIRSAATLARMPLFERFHAQQLEKQVRAYRSGASAVGVHLCTGNVSLRRSDYFAVGGFDPSLQRSEDRELGIRLELAGAKFTFDERAFTIHGSDHTSLDVWRQRAFLYGVCDSRISDKHKSVPAVNPWRYLFLVSPLSRPMLLAANLVPPLGRALSDAAVGISTWCDRRGFEGLALRGTTLVYGLEYFRGMREHAGSLLGSARNLGEFLLKSATSAE
jgi:glycosyltransferase involved in cell wall biosynthesis